MIPRNILPPSFIALLVAAMSYATTAKPITIYPLKPDELTLPFIANKESLAEDCSDIILDNGQNNNNKDCDWVGEGETNIVKKRCRKKINKVRIWEYCRETCGKVGLGPCKDYDFDLDDSKDPPTSNFNINSRNTIIQMFVRSWNDIKLECSSGNMDHYGAIQVSPPQEHPPVSEEFLDGKYSWWLHYQPVNYRKLEGALGTRDEFDEMAAACNKRGVGIIVDVVINHMTAGTTKGTGSAGTEWDGPTQNYAYFSFFDFHSCDSCKDTCDIDYSIASQVQNCRLLGLNDLKTEAPYVQGQIVEYLNRLIAIPGVVGFRVDAAKHIAPGDLTTILDQVNGDPFVLLEILNERLNSYLGNYEELGIGTDTLCRGALVAAIRDNDTAWNFLNGIENGFCYGGGNPQSGNARKALWYISNHDDERKNNALSYYNDEWLGSSTQTTTYNAALAWILMYPHGVPRLTSGYGNQEGDWPKLGFDDAPPDAINGFNNADSAWDNFHRSVSIQNLLKIHNALIYPNDIYVTDKGKGNNQQVCWSLTLVSSGLGDAFVAINAGRKGRDTSWSATQPTSLSDGLYCNAYLEGNTPGNSCETETYVVEDGTVAFTGSKELSQMGNRILILSRSFGVATNEMFVSFEITRETIFGENVYITGSLLGWSTCNAIGPLNTRGYPIWRTTVALPAGQNLEWKPIVIRDECENPISMGCSSQLSTGAPNSEAAISYDWTKTASVTFEITRDIDIGETISITGSWLGWSTCNAIGPLDTTDYPIWRTSVAVEVPFGENIEWKPIIIRGNDCGNPVYLDGSNLQFSICPPDSEAVISFNWTT